MANKYEIELTAEEEEWQKKHPLGSFEDPEGACAFRIEIEDMPFELQEKAREIRARYQKEHKKK